MATVTFNRLEVNTNGELPTAGSIAPGFAALRSDMSPFSLDTLKGKNVVMNIFPSLDTPVCACSVRQFNIAAADLPNTAVLCISKDLPFAHARFCAAEGISNLITLSIFRDPEFEQRYGMLIVDGPLRGLLARGIVVINPEGRTIYTELVTEITNEPNYQSVVAAIGRQEY
jgi:thiol peroxidase